MRTILLHWFLSLVSYAIGNTTKMNILKQTERFLLLLTSSQLLPTYLHNTIKTLCLRYNYGWCGPILAMPSNIFRLPIMIIYIPFQEQLSPSFYVVVHCPKVLEAVALQDILKQIIHITSQYLPLSSGETSFQTVLLLFCRFEVTVSLLN